MKNLKKGFTLIELLVVVAIIGILASVVLGSLNSAKKSGSDASIQSNLANLKTQAEIIYGNLSGSYGNRSFITNCGTIIAVTPATNVFNDATVQEQIEAAIDANGGLDAKCQANGNNYVLAIPLKSDSSNAWCVDNHGNSKKIAFASLVSGMDCSLAVNSL